MGLSLSYLSLPFSRLMCQAVFKGIITISIYRLVYWSINRLSDLPKVTELVSDRATVWMQTDWPCPSPSLDVGSHSLASLHFLSPLLLGLNRTFYFQEKKVKQSDHTSSTFCQQTSKIPCRLDFFLLPVLQWKMCSSGLTTWVVGTQCKVKTQHSLFKKYGKFQGSNSRTKPRASLLWAQGPAQLPTQRALVAGLGAAPTVQV